MKILLPAMFALFAAASCDKSGEGTGGDGNKTSTPGAVVDYKSLDNEAAFNGDIFEIRSVVYTTEEIEGSWVFYLSPTANIIDLPGMLEADDYIRVVVGNTKGSNASFPGTDNEVCYESVRINADNCDDYKISRLFVVLDSPTVVRFEMQIEAATPNTMAVSANYSGYCTRWPSDDIEDSAGDRLCTHIAQAAYFGQGVGTNAHEYDLLVSTSPITQTTEGQLVLEEKEGYCMLIGFFAIPGSAYRTRLPQGTYKNSDNSEAGTYLSVSYIGKFETENGRQTMKSINFDGDITVTTNNEGITTIRGYFLDESNRRQMIAFRGNLGSFLDATSASYLPALNEDVDFKASAINAIYYGRMGDEAFGTFELVIYEGDYLEQTEETFAATLMLTAPTLFTTKESLEEGMSKLNGQYYGASTFTQKWTWFRPVELNAYGIVQPFGTFVHKIDGSYYGAFGYAQDGTVTISDAGDGNIKIDFEFISNNGSNMKGSYEGPIEWDWQVVASDGDDGTSTLEADYDLTLDRITEARLVVPQQIYIGGVGYTNMNEYYKKWGSQSASKNDDIGYQYIAFGNVGANKNPDGSVNEGDFVYIELVTAPGEERQLKPGHYFVSRERWPAYFHPMKYGVEIKDEAGNTRTEDQGVAIKGMLLNNTAYTSHWEHHYASEGGLSVIDGHAYFYGGELWITDNGNGTYTFDFDCTCVRKHHVRGQWTGPVTGLESTTASASASWHAPLKRPVVYTMKPATGQMAAEMAAAATDGAQKPALEVSPLSAKH